jgi:predicted ATPase
LQAHHCQWATLYMVGELQECCRHIEAGLALYEHERDHRHASLYGGHDARVCGLGESALAFWMLGRSREALARADSALEWSTELSHVGSRVHALDYSLVLQRFGQDAAAVQSQAEALYAFASEQRLRVFRAKGQFFRGWARAMQGAVAEGLSEMLDGIASERAADTPHDFTLYYEMLAEVYALAGRAEDGLRAIHDAFEVAQRNGIVFWNAELHRRYGELLLVSGNRLAAQAAFEEGLTWARRQGSRPLELRAAIGLCRVHQNTGERAAFLSLVQTLHDGLRGEGDTPDLEAARMVLERLQ